MINNNLKQITIRFSLTEKTFKRHVSGLKTPIKRTKTQPYFEQIFPILFFIRYRIYFTYSFLIEEYFSSDLKEEL